MAKPTLKHYVEFLYPGTTYLGRVMTLEDVQKEVPNSDILQDNIRNNHFDRVVRTIRGNFKPLMKGDIVKDER